LVTLTADIWCKTFHTKQVRSWDHRLHCAKNTLTCPWRLINLSWYMERIRRQYRYLYIYGEVQQIYTWGRYACMTLMNYMYMVVKQAL
jgi:hypothetical protein